VNAQGKVVASDDERTIGAPRQPPDRVFRKNLEPVLLSSFERRFRDGKHLLVTPLMQQDTLLGYLSVALSDQAITALYEHVYATLLLAALTGLAAVIALGALLQVQLKRMGAGLAALMKAIAKGDAELPAGTNDEFAEVRHAAGRLGEELSAARGQTMLAQNKLSAVANIFDVGVILIGADGAPEYLNQTAKQTLVGDRPGEFEARFAELRAELNEALKKLCQDGGLASMRNIDIIDAAGVIKRLRVEAHALDAPENKGFLMIIKNRDLIDAMDEDLRAATQSRSLSRLYTAAAHELKAPLNAMSLHLEMLKRSLEAKDANARGQRHYVEVSKQELARLNRLLHSMLDYSVPAYGGRVVLDLRQLIDELGMLLMPQARHQRVTLALDQPSVPVSVFGNAGQIKQTLLNITLNALECVAEGGRVDIHLNADPSAAMIAICDDGPGMPAALQARIFDMHFTTKETGTGIGLYVARAVTKAHGGEIRVDSQLGAGTCFTISLPLNRKSSTRDSFPSIQRGGLSDRLILTCGPLTDRGKRPWAWHERCLFWMATVQVKGGREAFDR
jgi:signal transduction histidine kinase